jgi:hypothetical protein
MGYIFTFAWGGGGGRWADWAVGGKVKRYEYGPAEAKVFVYAISMRALYMLAFYSMCERSRDLTPPPEVGVNSSLRHVLRRLLSFLPQKLSYKVI